MTESDAMSKTMLFFNECGRLIPSDSLWIAEGANDKLLVRKMVVSIGGQEWVTMTDTEEQFHTGLDQARLFLAHFYRMTSSPAGGWLVRSADKSEIIHGVGKHPELALDDYRNNVAQHMKTVATEYETAIKRKIWPQQ